MSNPHIDAARKLAQDALTKSAGIKNGTTADGVVVAAIMADLSNAVVSLCDIVAGVQPHLMGFDTQGGFDASGTTQ